MADSDNAFQKFAFQIQKFAFQHPRKFGLVFLGLGFGFIYWWLILPIQQSESGVSEISISLEGATVGIVAVLVGLGHILLGPAAGRLFRPTSGKSKMLLFVAGLALGGIGTAAYLWLKHFLESGGYVFR